MKRFASFLIAALALTACCGNIVGTDLTHWKLQREGDPHVYDAVVPCTVAGALNEAGVFGENVLEQDRYFDIDTNLFKAPWVFTTTFKAEKGLHHVLRFEGLSYSADIWVNGKQIAAADTTYGPFLIREYDITQIAMPVNLLKVRVFKAPKQSLNNGYVDWNPRPVDESMGIWRKVELISTPDVRIADIFVKPEVNVENLKEASFTVEATLVNHSQYQTEGSLRGVYDSGQFELPVSLAPGETKTITVQEPVAKPRIWWSCDMGKPELYTLNLSFAKGDKVSDSRKVRFGLRDIKGEIDEFGHRLFKLNGKPVLIKSAGWTDDIFMQDPRERTLKQLELVRNMNLNSVRFENIWSKDGAVYDLCDSLGLLAIVGWSCQWEWESYCGYPEVRGYGCINDPETEDLAIRYLHDQIIWMRNHPSVISWAMGSDRVPNERLEEGYIKWYNQLEYRPYVVSSKGMSSKFGGPSGMKMEGPYEYVAPDYWFIDTEHGGNYGFNTETGIGMNIPQSESLRKIVGEENLWPLNRNWDLHCTASSTDMNSAAEEEKQMTNFYGAPTGFEDFVRKAHALDYDGTRSMYEAFRVAVPRTTGIVQWMLNSAWPSLYWQQFDWYLVPTAGYYGTQKACEPVQLIYNYGDHSVWAVDEVVPEAEYTAVMKIYGPDSQLLCNKDTTITIVPREPQKLFEGIDGPCFVALELINEKERTVADNFYCVGQGNNVYDWGKSNWYQTPITEYVDLSFVSALPQTEVEMKTKAKGLRYKVTLTNNSDVIAYQNILKAKDQDGELIPAVLWSDNFFSLLPGQSKTVSCTLPDGDRPASITMEGWNAVVRQAAPDSLDRNQSKYAVYDFSRDDRYSKDEAYETVQVSQPKGKKVKNVIFMIGDGMGFEQVSCGWVVNGGKLNMDQMPVLGASRTYAVDKLITDSCAGGAALAGGTKTRYGFIGLDPDGNVMETSLKVAQRAGKKTGITVTCRLNDATPADFCNHSPARRLEEDLTAQYITSDVDFISGGGLHFWNQRSDGRNLVEEMQAKGYTFVDKLEDIAGAEGDKFLGIYDEYDLEEVAKRGPVLLESTKKAIEMLDNKKGFFLMIEGSQIDDWAHRNKVGNMCEELFDFDRTLGYVLQWAEKDGQTLVVVTADHATGGLTLLGGDLQKHEIKVNYSTKGHNGILVPVFAYGPHAEDFTGVHENAEIARIVKGLIK
ncbi:MAG: alkaline phosphatase [Bacteroidales bacterium]|nr:alkaline phosphatase [Bacteroidales bacterium]